MYSQRAGTVQLPGMCASKAECGLFATQTVQFATRQLTLSIGDWEKSAACDDDRVTMERKNGQLGTSSKHLPKEGHN